MDIFESDLKKLRIEARAYRAIIRDLPFPPWTEQRAGENHLNPIVDNGLLSTMSANVVHNI